MRLTIEDTSGDNNQKTVLECQSDEVPLGHTIDMFVRLLLAYGYDQATLSKYFEDLSKNFDERQKNLEESADDGEEMS
jgi:hypothetical protein